MSGLEARVREALAGVHDPCSVAAGTPLSLVDMGLLLGCELRGDGTLTVRLGVTFAGCTMAPHFARAAEEALAALPEVRAVEVALDAGEPWTPERATPAGRALLRGRSLRFAPGRAPRPREWRERAPAR